MKRSSLSSRSVYCQYDTYPVKGPDNSYNPTFYLCTDASNFKCDAQDFPSPFCPSKTVLVDSWNETVAALAVPLDNNRVRVLFHCNAHAYCTSSE